MKTFAALLFSALLLAGPLATLAVRGGTTADTPECCKNKAACCPKGGCCSGGEHAPMCSMR